MELCDLQTPKLKVLMYHEGLRHFFKKVEEVILNGVYDYYQRGRVSNILKTFSHMNMHLEVDGVRVEQNNVDDFQQHVNMKRAEFITTFSVKNASS